MNWIGESGAGTVVQPVAAGNDIPRISRFGRQYNYTVSRSLITGDDQCFGKFFKRTCLVRCFASIKW